MFFKDDEDFGELYTTPVWKWEKLEIVDDNLANLDVLKRDKFRNPEIKGWQTNKRTTSLGFNRTKQCQNCLTSSLC